MTTMGTYNQDFDSQFNFLKNQSKRVLYGFQPKPQGQASRGSNTNNKQSNTSVNAYNTQARKYSKGSQAPRKNSNNFAKEERYPVNNYYGKAMGSKYSNKAPKMIYASTASDSDSKEAHIQSELYGFKIIQNGHVIHDETVEDVDLFESDDEWPMTATSNEKFAASVLTIGPNAKEISLPSFA